MNHSVLVVENSDTMRNILRTYLESDGYEVAEAKDGGQAIEALMIGEMPDLVVTGIDMPGMNGIDLTKNIRELHRGKSATIIMISSKDSIEEKVQGLKSGADDYITKPFDMSEFLARTKIALMRSQEQRSLDPLTGLPGNTQVHRLLMTKIEAGESFADLCIDIDSFRCYNDAYGFKKGDEVIEFLADTIMAAINKVSDGSFIGHLGGDTFMVVCPPAYADAAAEDIIAGFDEGIADFYFPEDRKRGYIVTQDRRGNKHKVRLMTLSIGIVSNEHRELKFVGEVMEIYEELRKSLKKIDSSKALKDKRKG